MEEFAVYTDGGARGNPGPAACAFVVLNSKNEEVYSEGFYLGETTNNIAEYTGVLNALQCPMLNVQCSIRFYLDSELVVKQLKGEYKIKNSELRKLYDEIQLKIKNLKLKIVGWTHVRREQNARADEIVNQTLDAKIGNRKI